MEGINRAQVWSRGGEERMAFETRGKIEATSHLHGCSECGRKRGLVQPWELGSLWCCYLRRVQQEGEPVSDGG